MRRSKSKLDPEEDQNRKVQSLKPGKTSIFDEKCVVRAQLIKWNKKKEKKFKKNRVDSRNIFHKLADASNYLDCGLSPFVQEVIKDNKANNLREKLLEEFMGGRYLTAEEHKYLNLTSEELNKMIDRPFYQKAVNCLENDYIEDIENCIADDILLNYMKIRKKLKNQRKKYLKRKCSK